MGQRANFVICRNKDWQLYYDHWCANRLDIELFWGASNAAAFIEQRKPLENRNDWLNEVWCEGGAVLDYDNKRLLWFGGEDILYDIPLRRAFLALMLSQWSGWKVQWASGDIAEIGAYLDFPVEKFLVKSEPDDSEALKLNTEYPEDNNILLTVREQNRVTATQICGDNESLELGASQLEHILSYPRTTALEWVGEMPQGGIHLDVDNLTLHYWFAWPISDLERRIARKWPTWQCTNLESYFEKQLALADTVNIQLPERTTFELQQSIIDHFRLICQRPASNPAKELAPKMGENVVISSWTDEARGSFGSEELKHRILDDLAGEIERSKTME